MNYQPVCILTFILALIGTGCADATQSNQEESAPSQNTQTTIDRVPLSESLKMMQGSWQIEGTQQKLEITRRKYVLSMGDSILQDATIDAYSNCPGFCSLGGDVSGISCFVVKGEFDATCYAIMKLTDSNLVCSLMGGNGEIITFKRVY